MIATAMTATAITSSAEVAHSRTPSRRDRRQPTMGVRLMSRRPRFKDPSRARTLCSRAQRSVLVLNALPPAGGRRIPAEPRSRHHCAANEQALGLGEQRPVQLARASGRALAPVYLLDEGANIQQPVERSRTEVTTVSVAVNAGSCWAKPRSSSNMQRPSRRGHGRAAFVGRPEGHFPLDDGALWAVDEMQGHGGRDGIAAAAHRAEGDEVARQQPGLAHLPRPRSLRQPVEPVRNSAAASVASRSSSAGASDDGEALDDPPHLVGEASRTGVVVVLRHGFPVLCDGMLRAIDDNKRSASDPTVHRRGSPGVDAWPLLPGVSSCGNRLLAGCGRSAGASQPDR